MEYFDEKKQAQLIKNLENPAYFIVRYNFMVDDLNSLQEELQNGEFADDYKNFKIEDVIIMRPEDDKSIFFNVSSRKIKSLPNEIDLNQSILNLLKKHMGEPSGLIFTERD